MVDARDTDLDSRYPTAFQRGGASDDVARVPATAAPRLAAEAPVLDRGVAVAGSGARDVPRRETAERAHFEIIVAGNPWLRALWVVGSLTLALSLALTVYSEFMFSIAPTGGIYDPATYVVPRIAQMLALPLSIAGVVALTAAACLRIVAWRPSGAQSLQN